MTKQFLVDQIRQKKSYLCVGLDTDINKIPRHLSSHADAIFQFNKSIIDATTDFCVAYKINTAFYEAQGINGWQALEKTVNYIPETHFKIADAKRGDIGNTSSQYAKAFFETLNFDAITVNAYMGEDSIKPFLEYEHKWTIALGLTSNQGAQDFELLKIKNRKDGSEEMKTEKEIFLYESVITKVSSWAINDNVMFVVGATKASNISSVRKIIPEKFLLVPGVGAQGGNLDEVSKAGLTEDCGLLVNVSRDIIYAANEENFATEAAAIAQHYQQEMEILLSKYSLTQESISSSH